MDRQERVRATVIGHSYVARLHQGFENGTFVPRGPESLSYNFVGIGGAKVYPTGCNKSIFRVIEQVKSRGPNVIFLHCGENGIGSEGVSPQLIATQLIRLMEELARQCRPQVLIVSQLTKFPAHSRYGDVAESVTGQLVQYAKNRRRHIGNTRLKVWKHTIGINGVERGKYFDRDDIHLNREAMRKYYHSVTAAVGRYARVVIEERKFNH